MQYVLAKLRILQNLVDIYCKILYIIHKYRTTFFGKNDYFYISHTKNIGA